MAQARFSSAANAGFTNTYNRAKFDAMADGLVDEVKANCYKETVTAGSYPVTYTNGAVDGNIRAGTTPRSYDITITGQVAGQSFQKTVRIGNRKSHPAFFALWTKKIYSDSLLATTVVGSAYFGDDATFTGSWSVNGDLLVAGVVSGLGTPTVQDNFLKGVRTKEFTDPPMPPLKAAATALSGGSKGDFTFTGLDSDGYYPCWKRDANFSLSGGTLTGKGTVVIDGNLSINGNYSYGTAGSRVVFIVNGDLNVNTLVTQIVGTYYVKRKIKLNGVALTIPRGNLCGKETLERALCALDITQDTIFLQDEGEALSHRMPGYWTDSSGPR